MTEVTLKRKAASPYGLQYQLTRDTALFGPDRILIFDGAKVTKQQVMSEFLRVIKGDKYLLEKWGRQKAITDASIASSRCSRRDEPPRQSRTRSRAVSRPRTA